MIYQSVAAKHIGDAIYLVGSKTFDGEVGGNVVETIAQLTPEDAYTLSQQILDEAGKIK